MKILIVNLLSIDTEKAYAVTISCTGEALKKTVAVDFLGPAQFSTTGFDGIFEVKWKRVSKSLWRLSKLLRYPFVDRISLLLVRSLVYIILVFNRNNLKSYAIWTRDIRIALLASKLNIPTLCEVHKTFSHREISSLNRASKFTSLVFSPISSHLKSELLQYDIIKQNNVQLVQLPMGVKSEFLNQPSFRNLFQSYPLINIGYFGSMSSMGVSSEIDFFIRKLAQVTSYRFRVLLVGIGKEGKLEIDKLIEEVDTSRLNIQVVERVKHQLVPNLMKGCDILVVPYGEGSLNLGRFPIKIVEYAASKIPILCSDTPSNRSILGESRAWFFSYDKSVPLVNVIEMIVGDTDLREEKIRNAYQWAKELSYEKRAEKILCALAQFYLQTNTES